VLLEIQTHGGARQTTYDTTKKLGNTEEEVAGVIPNLLGNSLMCLVNHERDNSEGLLMETDGAGQVLGNEHTVCLGGVNGMEDSGQRSGDAVGPILPLTCLAGTLVGPSNQVEEVFVEDAVKKGVSVNSKVILPKPKTIRSRKGDLFTVRPADGFVGVPKAKGPSLGDKAQRAEQKSKASSSTRSKSYPKSDVTSKNIAGNKSKLISQNLPFNMLRKLSGGLYQGACQKKNSKGHGGGKGDTGGSEETDSIRNSDLSGSEQSQGSTGSVEADRINLEVVLHGSVEEVPVLARNIASSTNLLLLSDGGGVIQSREEEEASKLRIIAEDMGMVFHGNDEAISNRIVSMEGRDFKEKDDWEMKRGNGVVQ
jgi:hypothetical protein